MNDSDNNKDKDEATEEDSNRGKNSAPSADIIVEPPREGKNDNFTKEFKLALKETEEILSQRIGDAPFGADSWKKAGTIVENFRPIPWFIWRLSNYVYGQQNALRSVSEGLVFGLRRLLFAGASDPLLGSGEKVNSVSKALKILPPDGVAAISIIHAISRRLATYKNERFWKPVLDEALLRARIGWMLGKEDEVLSAGRGMLAGFSSRSGLAVLLASGDLDQATSALEMLATGRELRDLGTEIYGCDPLQVSSLLLSAAGCGRDASFGIMCYAVDRPLDLIDNEVQLKWFSVFTIVEKLRADDEVEEDLWKNIGITDHKKRKSIAEEVKTLSRRGHGWPWLV